MAFAIGLPFSILLVVLTIMTEGVYLIYALMLISASFILTAVLLHVLYRGMYHVNFTVDSSGVRCYTTSRQAQSNKLLNALTVFAGLLSRQPAAAGAGVLAQARQQTFIRWNRVTKIRFYDESQTILVRAGYFDSVAIFCAPDNYPEVSAYIKSVRRIST